MSLYNMMYTYIFLSNILMWSLVMAQDKDCIDLQNADTLVDGDEITLTQNCILNTTTSIKLNNIQLTIYGRGHQIDFITDDQYLFEITNNSILTLQNLQIESPTKYTSSSDIKSIFYLSNNSSLTLNVVQFTNNISNASDYRYTQYIIYAPQTNASSSISINHSSFQSNFAVRNGTIYMSGTANVECPQSNPCCKSQIYIADTTYNGLSQSFVTATCSDISIINSNITNNVIATLNEPDCLLCFGSDTKSTINDNIFDNNNGIILYAAANNNDILVSNLDNNVVSNHANTAIAVQSNTNPPSILTISNITVIDSNFDTTAFLKLSANTKANIQITHAFFNDNSGVLIASEPEQGVSSDDGLFFTSCLDEYSEQEAGIWIIQTIFDNNDAENATMFDIKHQRLSLTSVNFTNNIWTESSLFNVEESSLYISDGSIHSNSDDAFNGMFMFNKAYSLCFNPSFMYYALNETANSFTMSDFFAFTNTINDVKGVEISDIALDNCEDTTTVLDPVSVEYIKFSHFNATNCAMISMNASRDNAVAIDFYDGVLNNSSMKLNLNVYDRINVQNCHFSDSFIQLSSGIINTSLTSVSYGILATNVKIDNCEFEGNLTDNKLIQIYANDDWLPSVTFSHTDFYDLSLNGNNSHNNPLILISTVAINNSTKTVPYVQSAIQFISCNFNYLSQHLLTVIDDAIYDDTAPISRIYFTKCSFEEIDSTIIYHAFNEQAAIKFDFVNNDFANITAYHNDHGMLHFEGFACNRTYAPLLNTDISFTNDVFEYIHTTHGLIYGSCLNLGLTQVVMENNKGDVAYGISITKSSIILSSVRMSGNSQSTYGGVYCFTQIAEQDEATCNMQIVNSVFSDNEAMYGGVISFDIRGTNINEFTSIRVHFSEFVSNMASFGGAVYIDDITHTGEIITFYDVKFMDNAATVGGALYIKESGLNCDNCQFMNNSAVQYGGAMVMMSDICTRDVWMDDISTYPRLTLSGGTNVYNNDALFGGGLALVCYDLYTENVLYGSNGDDATQRGGAIFAHKTCLRSLINNTFVNNNAQYGGSVAVTAPVSAGSGCINNVTQNVFINNIGHAQTGGILITTAWLDLENNYNMPVNNEFNITFYEYWFANITDTQWIFEIYNNTFDANIGGNHGGAILISPADFIDEIVVNASNETIPEIASFIGAANHYEINIFDNVFVENEISDDTEDNYHGGGAIAWLLDTNSSATLNIYDCTFTGNQGNAGQGGAIWVNCYDCSFRQHSFLYYSAAYDISRENACEYCSYETYSTDNVALNIYNLTFTQNNASAGGAIAVSCIGNLHMSNIAFSEHYADFYGGSIYMHQLLNVDMEHIIITNTLTASDNLNNIDANKAVDSKGGAIYASCITHNLSITLTDISNARSIIGGAVFLYETPSISITASQFSSNQAILAGSCIAIFTPGVIDRNIDIFDVEFTANPGAALGATIYIGSYRDIILLFDGNGRYFEPPFLDVWDFEDFLALEIEKRHITKSTENVFTFTNNKYAEQLLSMSRIIIDLNIESNNSYNTDAVFSGTPQWNASDALLYDAAGDSQAWIDRQRSFGNVIFLQDAYGADEMNTINMYEGSEYTFKFDGDAWTDALDKSASKNITFRYDMIGLIQNAYYDDEGVINIDIDHCTFTQNGHDVHSVIGNVYIDDPYGIASVSSTDNDFILNSAKVGSALVHLAGYGVKDSNPIDLSANNEDVITNCNFIDNVATDTGNIVIHNADLSFVDSLCSKNKAGLDGSCIATYSSTLEVANAVIETCITQVSGAIYTDLSIVRIQGTNFTNNIADFGDGSCIYSKRMIPLILGDCPSFTFEALYEQFSDTDTATNEYLFSVADCLFDNNTAYTGSGGAIYVGTDYDRDLLSDNATCTGLRQQLNEAAAANTGRRLLQFNDTNSTINGSIMTTSLPLISTTQFFVPTTPSPTTEGCINIDIVPDAHLSDISWTLTGLEVDGTVTGQTSGVGLPQLCLNNTYNDSCLEFTIDDSFGDGLSYGEGTWHISWYGEEWSSVSNGNYYHSETFQFCKSSVFLQEESAVIDIVVSIVDDTDSLDFVIAFLDDITPMFEDRISSDLVFSNIFNGDVNTVIGINLETMCISNGESPMYCSTDGIEAIIDALAVLCIWNSTNDTLLEDFQDYWGGINGSNLSVVADESASFAFLQMNCDSVELSYDDIDKEYTLSSGAELLDKTFQFFDHNEDDIDEIQGSLPLIGNVSIAAIKDWIYIWDYESQDICQFYAANTQVIELICNTIEFNVNIKPGICQYDSCIAQHCTADTVVIVYNSVSQVFFEEDAQSVAYNTGPTSYELTDLEFVPIGEYSLDTKCFANYALNASLVRNKGVLLFTNSTCNHDAFIVQLQEVGVRAVIIGEDMLIPHTDAPTPEPTAQPTVTAVDSLFVFVNGTLSGINMTHFEDVKDIFTSVMIEAISVPVEIVDYAAKIPLNDILMNVRLDATYEDELWRSLKGESREMYLQLLEWSMLFELTQQINAAASFTFLSDEVEFVQIAPTPHPTPTPTQLPTPTPTVQTVYIPVRTLKGSSGKRFAETAYFMSILNYTNDAQYDPPDDVIRELQPGINDLKVSFVCDISLPTPQPTPSPTDRPAVANETETYLSDEISIYGYDSTAIGLGGHPHPKWIVSLSEYLYNASCQFIDLKDDGKDVSDTSQCKPRLDDLYQKCLMQVKLDEDGTVVEKRTAQIDTIVSPVDTLCIYQNIANHAGFLVPERGSDGFDVGLDSDMKLVLNDSDNLVNVSRPCQEKYRDGTGLISVNNFAKGTYCFFIDKDEMDGSMYTLTMEPVYKWRKPFMQIYSSHFTYNYAYKNGGAVALSAESGLIGDYSSMVISETSFAYNYAVTGIGGAIYKASAVDETVGDFLSILLIDNITGNEWNKAGYAGGSVGIESPYFTNIWRTAVLINNIDFYNNLAVSYGGALYANWSNVYILDSIFSDNKVKQSGGAIYLVSSGFGALDTTFRFNAAINESASNVKSDDKVVQYQYDNDGGAIYSSFYDLTDPNPACIGVYSVYFENNTAGNAGGAMWLGLYGNEANFGASCIKLSNIKFGNASYNGGTANKAYDGGRSVFLNVSEGRHAILFSETSITKLCFTQSNICKQFESTVFHMCVQEYEVAAGVCNLNISREIGNLAVDWVDSINHLSLATTKIEMFPGDSKMFQVFGWDVYGNQLYPNEWSIDVSALSDDIDLTETIQSPVFDSWLFPLFTKASKLGTNSSGKIFDLNGVALDLIINIEIVDCSDGYEYRALSTLIYTCTPCSAGTYIMNSLPCVKCDLGLECLGTNHVKIAQYWYGKPQTDGRMALQLCPPGVCCSIVAGCDFNQKDTLCALNRDPEEPLCGACLPPYTETSSASGACGMCGPYSSLIFLLPGLLGFLLVLYFLKKLSKKKQDIPHPLVVYVVRSVLFVYQLLPILTFQSSSAIFQPLASFSNFEIDLSATSSDGAGSCYLQELGPRDKIGVGLVPSFILLTQLLILYIAYRLKLKCKPSASWTEADSKKWNLAFYQTFWQLGIMLYAKATASLLKLSDCRPVGDYGLRMWYAGSIKCPDVYHGVAWFLLAVMFLIPFFVVYILRREYHSHHDGKGWKHLRKKYPALVMPYRRDKYWYSAWNLARRFILIGIASIPTKRPDYSASALAVVVGFVLGFHVFCRPFYHELNNKLETFCLFCAFGVSILNIMLNKPAFYAIVTASLAFAPLVPIIFLMYAFFTDKLPFTVAITKDEYVDDTPAFFNKPRKTTRIEDFQRVQTIKQQKRENDAALKTFRIWSKTNFHIIRKDDLLDEVGVDAYGKSSGRSVDEEEEFYPTDDDQTWSGHSQLTPTADGDFIDEELDERTLWQVLTGQKFDMIGDEEESLNDILSDDSSKSSELQDNETKVGEDSDDADDHVNDYFFHKKHKGVTKETSLFGGKLKFKQGLKAQKKILKEQREMVKQAKKLRAKQEKEKLKQLIRGPSFKKVRGKGRGRSTAGNASDAYFDETIGLSDDEGATVGGHGTTLRGIGSSIQLAGLGRNEDDVEDFMDMDGGEDPFEIERRKAAMKKEKRIEKKRQKAEEEARRQEEAAQKSNEEQLDDLWGDTDGIKSVEDVATVGDAANEYLSQEVEAESSDEEDDDMPANALLDDEGRAVIQGSINFAMHTMLDIAFGADVSDDDDVEMADIIQIDIEEEEEEENENDIQEEEKIGDIVHSLLGSDALDADATKAVLQKSITPNTQKLIDKLQFESADFDDDFIDDAMDMVMELQDEEEEEAQTHGAKKQSKIIIEQVHFDSDVIDIDDAEDVLLADISSAPL